jgi:hypothetical protein
MPNTQIFTGIACLSLTLLTACATVNTRSIGELLKDVKSETQLAFHRPGVRQLNTGAEVLGETACAGQLRPTVTEHELIPSRLAAGREVGMRWVYVWCSPDGTQQRIGAVSYQVLHNGAVVWNSGQGDMEIRPGRWVINNLVTVPKQAPAGSYQWVVKVDGRSLSLRTSADFMVTN